MRRASCAAAAADASGPTQTQSGMQNVSGHMDYHRIDQSTVADMQTHGTHFGLYKFRARNCLLHTRHLVCLKAPKHVNQPPVVQVYSTVSRVSDRHLGLQPFPPCSPQCHRHHMHVLPEPSVPAPDYVSLALCRRRTCLPSRGICHADARCRPIATHSRKRCHAHQSIASIPSVGSQ